MISAATLPEHLSRWHAWLDRLVPGVQQVVHSRHLTRRAYLFRLSTPWQVTLGDHPVQIRWIGVGLEIPQRGLLYLATGDPAPGHRWPQFEAALFTTAPLPPAPVPPAQPLARYLQQHSSTDAFVTVWPEEWPMAVRLRGIDPVGWPAPTRSRCYRAPPHLTRCTNPTRIT